LIGDEKKVSLSLRDHLEATIDEILGGEHKDAQKHAGGLIEV